VHPINTLTETITRYFIDFEKLYSIINFQHSLATNIVYVMYPFTETHRSHAPARIVPMLQRGNAGPDAPASTSTLGIPSHHPAIPSKNQRLNSANPDYTRLAMLERR